jgi:pimeloyl-ACP methyl ester carboxylesterase
MKRIGAIIKLGALLVSTLLLTGALLLAGFTAVATFRQTLPAGTAPDHAGHYTIVEGLKIHYHQWGPPEGQTIVLIHGTLAWSETWRDIAEPLGAAGYRVIAPDLPPFGYSERPGDGDYSRLAQARLVAGFVDALGLEDFALAGHSFGGGATVEAALDLRERIKALVLIDVAISFAPSRPKPIVRALRLFEMGRTAVAAASFANPLVTGIGLRSFVHDPHVVTDERLDLYRAPLVVENTAQAIGDWMNTGLFGDHTAARSVQRDVLAGLDIPTLVIWGRQDTVTPLEQGEDIAGLLPNARLLVLDGVNHIPHIERSDLVVNAIRSFIPPLWLRPGD